MPLQVRRTVAPSRLVQILASTSVAATLLLASAPSWAALGASVTLASGQPTDIYPGETTQLQITLSNNNTTAPITGVGFSNLLPGTLPNGLMVSGAATYTCTDPAGPTTSPGVGTLTAAVGSQTISLGNDGVIPARANNTDGTCTIIIPVTAGTSTGNAATYTYTIASGAVTGNDGSPQSNSGAVNQSINVRALTQPSISKAFTSSTLTLGGTATTLTLTLTNTNPVTIPNFSITDAFPQLGGSGIIKVAGTPNATASCNNGGAAPSFSPAAGDKTISATGTIPALSGATNGSCTLTVQVEADHTNGLYSTGAQTNTINRTTQFSNDLGIPAAANATASITVRSPLRISKSFAHASLSSGQSDSLTITLFNDGTSPLGVISFADDPIDGTSAGNSNAYGLKVTGQSTTCAGGVVAATVNNTGVTLTGGSIPAAGSCTVTVQFTGISQTAGVPISYTNTIPQGAVNVGNPAIVSQTASASILIADDLRILKSATPAQAAPGNPVRYSVTIQNFAATAENNVVVTDHLANGLTYLTGTINGIDYSPSLSGSGCVGLSVSGATGSSTPAFTIGTLPARVDANTPAACVITFYAMTATGASNGSSTANTISAGDVCYNAGATCNGSNSNTAGGTVTTTVLSATKLFDGASTRTYPEGTVSTLRITLSNNSANAMTNVSLSDTLPISGSGQLRIASPANAASTCGSPTITATAGSTSLAMSGATIPGRASNGTGAAGTCFIQVNVVGPAGSYPNTATVAGTETYADGTTHLVGPVSSTTATLTYTSALSATKSFLPTSVSSGGKSTVTVRLTNSGAVALTSVAVTDPLPTGMVLANPANAYTTCAGATAITANAGASSISMSGAAIAGSGNCDLIFDVIATGSANWTNTIPVGNITANGGVSNQTAVSGTLLFSAPTNLTVAKATNPSTLTFPGQVSQLTITINNGSQAVSGLQLTDYFTADGTSGAAANGMAIASTPAAATTCPGGSVTATPGGQSVRLTGASMAASGSCTVTVNVTSTSVGGITNFIPVGTIVTSQGLTNSGQASTSLTTQSNIGVTKQFTPNVVKVNERSRLRITFYNPTQQPASTLGVTDTLPAGLTVPSGPNPVTTCTGATVSAPAANQVQVSGGSIAAASGGVAASCYAEIDVVAATQGDYVNTIGSGTVSAIIGGISVTNSQPTTDTLRVKSPLVVHKAIAGLTLDAGDPAPFTTGTASRAPGAPATLTIRIENPNTANLTSAALTDALPSGLVVATTPNAATTCAGGVVTASASATQIALSGATIPATGSCNVTVDVLSNISGTYTNTIPAGGVTTFEGVSNEEPTSARIVVSTPPTVSKQFAPAVIAPNGTSTLTIVLGNSNASAVTLSAAFTDTLPTAPGNIVVAAVPNVSKTCPGAVTANAGAGTITYASGAQVPAGGCTISVDVTGATPGDHTNNIPAGTLQTNFGNNQQPANAVLSISTLGYISGKVFQDNNVTPNGTFQSGTDTPIQGASIELRSGADCSGALVSIVGLTNPATTDALGNYLFSGLPAGTYSVCEPVQPTGTTNGITSAGTITSVSGSTGTAGTASNPTSTSSQIVNIILGSGGGGSVSGSSSNNFAEVVLSSIAGTVFLDQNNNGVQNGADNGLAGVTLELLDNGGSVVATTTTDAAGAYSFSNLTPGNYAVREPTQPAGTSNGLTIAGTVGNGGTAGSVTNVTTTPSVIGGTTRITLPPNTAATGNNFAEIPNGRTLSGVVFLDYNDNGAINGPSDHGLGSQTINLTGTDINGNPVSRSTTTANDGSYSFTGLPEGTYTVTQPTQPTGTTNGQTLAGTTGGTATSQGVTPSTISAISLVGGNTVSANNNFAEVPGAAPDLTIAKTHSPASFAAGGSTGYFTITPSNIGSVATSGIITIVDTLPAGLTVAATPTGAGWTCTGAVGASTVTCTTTNVIAAGATGNPITLFVTVNAGATGQILTNTAVISGGNEPPGFDGNNTATDPVTIATAAQVSGNVWFDLNHDRIRNDPLFVTANGGTVESGWHVDLWLNGVLVDTKVTDANGAYAFTGIAPGSGYRILFHHPTTGMVWGSAVPNEQGIAPTSGTRDAPTPINGVNAGNPAGALLTGDGALNGLTLLSGDNIVEQSLPLDPSGVVYDAVTRNPVPGATVTLTSGGVAVPNLCLVSNQNTVTTDATGFYQFLLINPAPGGCPGSATYVIQVTPPPSYLPTPSALIPPNAGPFVPTFGGVDLIQAQATAPTGAQPTTYFFDFALTLTGLPGTSSSGVVNNHIPIDPILGGAIIVTKTTPLVNVSRGDLVPYTITATNTLAAALGNIDLRDQVPPGFKYKAGTATIDGLKVEPTVNSRNLTWSNLTFAAGQRREVRLLLVVGSGVSEGEYVNTAFALNNIANAAVSNTATATVRVVPDPTFDCSDLIGKVFDDQNANGYQDDGEPGIANVRLATVNGLLVTTDDHGRFHVTCAMVPNEWRGSNFLMKLDERSLPSGYRVTTENPRDVRLTRGKMSKLNFGATIHKVVRVDVADAAFEGDALKPEWASQFEQLPDLLKERPSILRLAYQVGAEGTDHAGKRLKALSAQLRKLWESKQCCHLLQIEEELIQPSVKQQEGR